MATVEVISRFDHNSHLALTNTIIFSSWTDYGECHYKQNFCTTAAYRPVRELLKHECLKDQERKKREEAEKSSSEEGTEAKEEASEERVITLRGLSMEDMRVAKSQVS